jgi:hypothetical protein
VPGRRGAPARVEHAVEHRGGHWFREERPDHPPLADDLGEFQLAS